MKELAPRITENGIDYVLIGDYYYPDLKLPEDEEPHYGKYGRMRLDFLKEHRKGLYSIILFEGRLVTHLNEIDDIANDRMDTLVRHTIEITLREISIVLNGKAARSDGNPEI